MEVMNTQPKLSELDATKLVNFQLRQQILTAERRAFEAQIVAAYGNPDEEIAIGNDGSIIRKPRQPVPAVPAATEPTT